MMTCVFIGIGSNLGEREKNIQGARTLLDRIKGIRFVAESRLRETDPVGGPAGQGKYLNAIWEIETSLGPRELMVCLLAIEKQLGRMRSARNAPRTLDLDILFYGGETVDLPDLTIPHPRLHERTFVLEPMVELDPDFKHPKFNKTMRELLTALKP